jgi:hypothetical protein
MIGLPSRAALHSSLRATRRGGAHQMLIAPASVIPPWARARDLAVLVHRQRRHLFSSGPPPSGQDHLMLASGLHLQPVAGDLPADDLLHNLVAPICRQLGFRWSGQLVGRDVVEGQGVGARRPAQPSTIQRATRLPKPTFSSDIASSDRFAAVWAAAFRAIVQSGARSEPNRPRRLQPRPRRFRCSLSPQGRHFQQRRRHRRCTGTPQDCKKKSEGPNRAAVSTNAIRRSPRTLENRVQRRSSRPLGRRCPPS